MGTKGLGGLKLGEVKHLPPTLSVVYYPLEKTSAFQPYVGAGINYTWFFDDKLTSEAENSALQLRGLDMKDSWGLAAQVGMDYMLTDNIMLNAQVRYIDIDTSGTTYSGDTKIKVDVDVDPSSTWSASATSSDESSRPSRRQTKGAIGAFCLSGFAYLPNKRASPSRMLVGGSGTR